MSFFHAAPRATVPLLSAALLLSACGGDPSGTAGGTGGTGGATGSTTMPVDFTTALETDGFQVQEGKFHLLDISDCCAPDKSCAGNNPSSPYSSYYLPRAPGQTVANPEEDAGGLSNTYRLGPDEAVVWVGETPPEAAYFGFTDYLMSRDDGAGQRTPVFASLGETTNVGVIGVDGPAGGPKFGRQAMIIHAADATVAARVRAAAVAGGFPDGAINVSPIDAANTHLGVDEAADTLGVLFRVALFEDATAGKAWLDAPPAKVYRVTPTAAPPAPELYGKATSRPKDASNDENPTYAAAVEELKQAILAAHAATHTAIVEDVSEGTPDPYACIAGTKVCAGDNRDTVYPATKPFLWLPKATDFIVVFGVSHPETGKATYANASVYSVDHLFGVVSATSKEWKGSASHYLPGHPMADQLYAYKLARDCNGDPYCLAVPQGTCPEGIDPGKLAVIAFRAYLEPATSTAPDPATLVRDGVIRFKTN